jgi:hypothetical protein
MKRSRLARIRRARPFIQQQPVRLRVVSKNLSVSPPIQSGVELLLNVVLREVFIQNVAKEFQRDRPVRLPLQRIPNLLNQRYMTEDSITKEFLARRDIRLGKFLSPRSNLHVACVDSAKPSITASSTIGNRSSTSISSSSAR